MNIEEIKRNYDLGMQYLFEAMIENENITAIKRAYDYLDNIKPKKLQQDQPIQLSESDFYKEEHNSLNMFHSKIKRSGLKVDIIQYDEYDFKPRIWIDSQRINYEIHWNSLTLAISGINQKLAQLHSATKGE